jgi:Fe-S-cluster containining protein
MGLEELHAALETARPLFDELQRLYQRLPGTVCQCDQPGVCCTYLPEMTAVEAMQWIDVLRARSVGDGAATLRRFVEFYLTNPIRHQGCPFRVDGLCSIYAVRSFACRAYGMWSRAVGRSRTASSRKAKHELLAMWKRYGIDLPADRVVFEIDYCHQVRVCSPRPLSDQRLLDLLGRVYALGQPLAAFQKAFEEHYHSDISFLIASLALGPKKALLGKFAVIQELAQKGTDQRLHKMLSMVKPEALF